MKNRLDLVLEKLLMVLPDYLTGNTAVMKAKYKEKYGSKNWDAIIHKRKKDTLTIYLIICILFCGIGIYIAMDQVGESNPLHIVDRPAFGEAIKTMKVRAKVSYGENEIKKDISLKARQKALTTKEKEDQLRELESRLDSLILGKNKEATHIVSALNLMDRDPVTGALIRWSSDKPEIMGEDGRIDFIKALPGEEIEIQALFTLDECEGEWAKVVEIGSDLSAASYEETMMDRLVAEVEVLNKSTDNKVVNLPSDIGEGLKVEWQSAEGTGLLSILFLFLLALAAVYMRRYSGMERELKSVTESIYRDLPDFMHKLTLLLNAGLVVSTALSKVAADYEAQKKEQHHRGKGESQKKYLYEEVCEIQKRVNQTKSPVLHELRDFAQRTGVRELVRMVTIISDNLHKGSTLVEKLEGEGELLWISKKKGAEEKGRLAETKLTFPLVLLLLVLIMMTIAPAMMDM